MEPLTQSFEASKKELMNIFPTALQKIDMALHGSSERLGLMSIKQANAPMLYAHLVEQNNDTTRVAIAPGQSYLKDRNQTERPDSTIQQLYDSLQNSLNKST